MRLCEKYGEWGIVCGGSVGMGGAYATRLAREGFHVVVTGRHPDTVEAKCRELETEFGVKTRALTVDFGKDDAYKTVIEATEGLEIGMMVYNAGLASLDAFQNREIEYEFYRLNVNVRSLLALAIHFVKPMIQRGRGAMIISCSDGGLVGNPYPRSASHPTRDDSA